RVPVSGRTWILNDVPLASPDVVSLFNRNDKDTAVADFASPGGLHTGFKDTLHHLVGKNDFDHYLWKKGDTVFCTSIDGFVPFLASMTAHFRNSHAGHMHCRQAFLHLFKLLVANDDFQKFHAGLFEIV